MRSSLKSAVIIKKKAPLWSSVLERCHVISVRSSEAAWQHRGKNGIVLATSCRTRFSMASVAACVCCVLWCGCMSGDSPFIQGNVLVNKKLQSWTWYPLNYENIQKCVFWGNLPFFVGKNMIKEMNCWTRRCSLLFIIVGEFCHPTVKMTEASEIAHCCTLKKRHWSRKWSKKAGSIKINIGRH